MDTKKFFDNYSDKQFLSDNTKTFDIPDPEVEQLISEFGGLSISRGIFRIHTYWSAEKWTKIATETFKELEGDFIMFGFDWLGRQYAKRISKTSILMFDIAEGKFYSLDVNVQGFLDEDLIEFAEDTLQINQFNEWNKLGISLKPNEIVAYKIPLALGGQDSPSNYEITDAEVDWEINRQIIAKTK